MAATMEISSVHQLCQQLITLAIQRCRLSESLCRLSVLIKRSSASDPPITQISISDTGVGSQLEELKDLKCSYGRFSLDGWDGVLLITTTSISDRKIHHYKLDLKEKGWSRSLTTLPPSSKNNAKFSGTEISLSANLEMGVLLTDITCLFRKMLILHTYNIAVELLAEPADLPGSQCQCVVLENKSTPVPDAETSNIEQLKSGLEDYLHKHGNYLSERCQSCFSNSEFLKVGKGIACTENNINNGLVVEAVIIISGLAESPPSLCARGCDAKTEVLYFKDFAPCSTQQSVLNALKKFKWNGYGLKLRSIEEDHLGSCLLEWENLPPNVHIDIALHCYSKQVVVPPVRQRTQVERKLTTESIRLALEDIKQKYSGVLISAHALKIRSYAPDLASSIAGLILSSNDHDFQVECLSLLGLHSQNIEHQTVENSIKEKIMWAIEKTDGKPSAIGKAAPCLFEDGFIEEVECQDEAYEADERYSFMDC